MKGKVFTNCVRSCLVYVSETWPIKVECETELNKNEMSRPMHRWMCVLCMNDSKKNSKVKGLL